MTTYKDDLHAAMLEIAKDPKSIFVGQSVVYGGQAMFSTFDGIPDAQRIEFPVAEDLQMGFCTGLAIGGFLPVCVYPRFDFLLLAVNQLVNHLDKLPQIAGISPKVIIRTAVGATRPINAGPQHTQDYTQPFRDILHHVDVIKLDLKSLVIPAYRMAMESDRSTILVEYAEMYNES